MSNKGLAPLFIVSTLILCAAFTEGREAVLEPGGVAPGEGARPVLRVKDDLARGRRWELGWGSASAYETATGERVRIVRLPGANPSAAPQTCAPDMLLSRTGALIVSSNAQPSLWRISPARFEVERFDIELDTGQGQDFGFTGLAWGESENVLYAVSADAGTLWRIDMNSARARKVELSSPVRGACGLSSPPGDRSGRRAPSLLVTIGAKAATARIALSADFTRGEVTRAPDTLASRRPEP